MFHERANQVVHLANGGLAGLVLEEVVEEVGKTLPNNWSPRLRELKGKMDAKVALNMEEIAFWETWKGYLYSDLAEEARTKGGSGRTLTRNEGNEIHTAELNLEGLIEACQEDFSIPDPNIKGPSIYSELSKLQGTKYLQDRILAAVIGIYTLVFMPFWDEGRFLNLGLLDVDKAHIGYRVYPCRSPIKGPENANYFQLVWKRLKLLGLDSGKPVFLEFFLPTTWRNGSLWDHVLGFLYYVVRMQMVYDGPIVVVRGPCMYKGASETLDSYIRRKRFGEKIGRVLRAGGIALGVPVWDMFVQTRQHDLTQYFQEQHFFCPFPLFSQTGEPTRELIRREAWEWDQIYPIMLKNSVSRATLFGLPDRRRI